jgi:hypothetical protein
MNAENDRQKNLVDTTDCLEAVSVFRGWKNILSIIVLLALLLIQLSFWAVDLDLVKEQPAQTQSQIEITPNQPELPAKVTDEAEVTSDTNVPIIEKPAKKTVNFSVTFKPVHIMWTIRSADLVIILAATLYCLTILFCLKISLIGRLGGINHICRAFFISLIMLVLILPWQQFLGWFVTGAVFEPSELMTHFQNYPTESTLGKTWYYLRFVGYWLVILLLLIFAQIRTIRWSRATLRRLEVA